MTQPLVMCAMPAAGRQSFVNRAIRCFRAQTYPNKLLMILDNGPEPLEVESEATFPVRTGNGVYLTRFQPATRRPIGELRNLVNAMALPTVHDADIIAHWDSDEYSSPERLTEQVALLQQSGAEAVGYSEMLFWDSRPSAFCGAWLFTSPNPKYCLGTSLCYWRRIWERRPFEHRNEGEDTIFLHRVKAAAASSIVGGEPRMVASIHGGNTAAKIEAGRVEWTRVQSQDAKLRRLMAL